MLLVATVSLLVISGRAGDILAPLVFCPIKVESGPSGAFRGLGAVCATPVEPGSPGTFLGLGAVCSVPVGPGSSGVFLGFGIILGSAPTNLGGAATPASDAGALEARSSPIASARSCCSRQYAVVLFEPEACPCASKNAAAPCDLAALPFSSRLDWREGFGSGAGTPAGGDATTGGGAAAARAPGPERSRALRDVSGQPPSAPC